MPVSQGMSEAAPPREQPAPTPRRRRLSLSPLTIVLLLIIIGIAGLLWLLSRPHSGPEVVVATAMHNMAAFTYVHEGDIDLTIRTGNPADAWNTLPSSPLLLLRPLKSGNTVRPSDVLLLAGVNMPQQPMIMNLRLASSMENQFQPGQQIVVLGASGHPLKVNGIFLSLMQDGHEAIVAISNADFLRFGSALASTAVTLVRPL